MLEVKTIEFTAKEGPSGEVLPPPLTNWETANAHLRHWALSAPEHGKGGYDKTFFKITWSDGDTYEGRIDLTSKGATLQDHIQTHLKYILDAEYEYYDQYKPEAKTLMETIQF